MSAVAAAADSGRKLGFGCQNPRKCCWVVRVLGGGRRSRRPQVLRHMCMCACEKRRRGTKRGAARVAPRTMVHSAHSFPGTGTFLENDESLLLHAAIHICIGRTLPQHCRSELKTRVIQWPMSEHRGLFIRIPRFHQNELVYLVVWSCKVADPNCDQDQYLTRSNKKQIFCIYVHSSINHCFNLRHSLLYSPCSSLSHASMQPC